MEEAPTRQGAGDRSKLVRKQGDDNAELGEENDSKPAHAATASLTLPDIRLLTGARLTSPDARLLPCIGAAACGGDGLPQPFLAHASSPAQPYQAPAPDSSLAQPALDPAPASSPAVRLLPCAGAALPCTAAFLLRCTGKLLQTEVQIRKNSFDPLGYAISGENAIRRNPYHRRRRCARRPLAFPCAGRSGASLPYAATCRAYTPATPLASPGSRCQPSRRSPPRRCLLLPVPPQLSSPEPPALLNVKDH
ncbi:hypothetical protein E2562_011358 [Oryza meyeriana var. granulata]|uniref:Uncharacterized protein n=1 Tax=Oryza meyeriana var. granulata TaxID=110450 RepID=A0A6G1BVU5_9ORYZ|nr:hypothetical protein E2562_011358 [Oryza meyeriana var. granulata]